MRTHESAKRYLRGDKIPDTDDPVVKKEKDTTKLAENADISAQSRMAALELLTAVEKSMFSMFQLFWERKKILNELDGVV